VDFALYPVDSIQLGQGDDRAKAISFSLRALIIAAGRGPNAMATASAAADDSRPASRQPNSPGETEIGHVCKAGIPYISCSSNSLHAASRLDGRSM